MSDLKTGQANLATGISNGFYGLNTTLLGGFADVNATVAAGTNSIERDLCDKTYNMMSQLNAISAMQTQNTNDLRNTIQSDFANLNYNLAALNCETKTAVNTGVRDIIDSNNANTRSILDFLVQDKIDSLTAENQSLKGQISQAEQNAYLINALGTKAAIPAYVVANPYTSSSCSCGL